MSNFSKVGIFMKTFGQEVKNKPSFSSDKINKLRIDLIKEELDELTDAIEQKKRFDAEQQRRQTAGYHVPPIDKDFISALSYGLPRCSGVAVGLDRLLAIIAGLNDLSQTMSFAHPVDH